MSDTAVAPAPADEAAGGRKKLVMIGGGVALLAIVAAAWFLVLAPDDDPEAAAAAEAEAAAEATEEGEILEVANFTASLAGPEAHFAKIGFSAVLSSMAMPEEVTPRFPLLQDAALTILAEADADELRTPRGGRRLRADLTGAAQEIWPDGEVLRVVLTELVVQ